MITRSPFRPAGFAILRMFQQFSLPALFLTLSFAAAKRRTVSPKTAPPHTHSIP